MTIEKITNHVELGLARLPEQYKNSPKLKGILAAHLKQIQKIEDASFDVYTNNWINTAQGAQLDMWGDKVGESRRGLDDKEYREAIYTRIQINRSGGEASSIINAVRGILNPLVIEYEDTYPAAFELYLQIEKPNDNISELVKTMIGVGIECNILTHISTNPPLVFSEVSGEIVDLQIESGAYHGEQQSELSLNTANGVEQMQVAIDSVTQDETGLGFGELYLYLYTMDLNILDEFNQELNISLALDDGSILELDTSDKIESFSIEEGGELIEVMS